MFYRGIPLYVASRASIPARPAMWKDLRDNHNWPIVSTWIDEAGAGETASMNELWRRIQTEILACGGLILYVEDGDFPLKGAFIEAGMALGMGKKVGIVYPGNNLEDAIKSLGSWVDHPKVHICHDVESARVFVNMAPGRVVDHCPNCGHAAMDFYPGSSRLQCTHCWTEYTMLMTDLSMNPAPSIIQKLPPRGFYD